MKKRLILLLATFMCIFLCACGGSESNSEINTDTTDENGKFQRETTEEGYIIISEKEFASYITKVELTKENWKEYMDIVEKTIERKNNFGDVISTKTYTFLTAKDAQSCYFDDDFAIELTMVK